MTENLRRRRIQGEGGFTLIELLIVIVILGILAGVVVASVSGITNTGGVSACKADTKTIITAEETYLATPGPPLGVGGGGVGGPSVYANMNWPYITPLPLATGPMVPRFLQAVSTLHAVEYVPATAGSPGPPVVPPTPASYNIYVIDKQCGVPLTPPAALPPGNKGAALVGPANPGNS